jgi:hypothetical protein
MYRASGCVIMAKNPGSMGWIRLCPAAVVSDTDRRFDRPSPSGGCD